MKRRRRDQLGTTARRLRVLDHIELLAASATSRCATATQPR
ncbi:hypothetical protein L083_3946 [Actinoplanes sp. N902-109]|nr:hypothetical protein L083_3946 [Actinoplanes sp. N902-109]